MASNPPVVLDQRFAGRLLSAALARGGAYADVYAQRSSHCLVHIEEGLVKTVSDRSADGIGIRVLTGTTTGYATCDDPDEGLLMASAGQAAAIASGGGGIALPLRRIDLPGRHPAGWLDGHESLAMLVDLGQRISRRVVSGDPRVSWVSVQVYVEDSIVVMATSDGRFIEDRRPLLKVTVQVTGTSGGRSETAAHRITTRAGTAGLGASGPEGLADEAVRRLQVRLAAGPSPAGTMPVVLAAGGAGGVLLHEAVGHVLEADFNRSGVGAYSGRLGEMVAAEGIRILDGVGEEGGPGSLKVDDEGIVANDATLIEGGRLVGYMHDRITAQAMGAAASGNGRRQDYRSHPQPRMRTTCLAAGPHDPQEIIGAVRDGLYVTVVSGGSVDIAKGDFNCSAEEAYRIRDGRIAEPVRGACLIGNGPAVMRRITMIGNDLRIVGSDCGKGGQFVPVGMGSPTVLVSELVVGGTTA